ncbi:MAG: SCO family protein [Parcubacteria group bacterium]
MNRHRSILLVVLVVGLVAAGVMAWKSDLFRPAPPPSDIGGAFQLTDQDGRAVDQDVLRGKWNAIFFGFTYCPDLCPTTLHTLSAAATLLGGDAKDFRIVFVSVDPERDNPKQMKAYLDAQGLPAGTLGLTGTPEQTAQVAKAYKVFYQKVGTGPDYEVNHTGVIYLMDPKGRFVSALGPAMSPQEMAGQIEKAMRG